MNYRIGIRTQNSHECLIQFNNVDSAAQGKNNNLIGKIIDVHGKNGTVRAKFKKGIPGQALGTTVELIA